MSRSNTQLRHRILLTLGLGCLSSCSNGGSGGSDTFGGAHTTGGTGGSGDPVSYEPGTCYGAPYTPSTSYECVALPGASGSEGGAGGAGGESPTLTISPECSTSMVWDSHGTTVVQTPAPDGQCCFEISSTCFGRPLLTPSGPRLAPTSLTGQANRSLTNDAQRLGTFWHQVARAEHASVAAFQRLGLELLQLGAPLDLLREAARATRDEIEHASLARDLVTYFWGRDVSFEPLDLTDLPLRATRLEVALATALEGCIEETLSLVVLQEQRRACRDPRVGSVLDRLIDDETRHVEFSWRLLAWLLDGGDQDTRRAVQTLFSRHLALPTSVDSEVTPSTWGDLTAAEVSQIRHTAIRDVLRPCASALLQRFVA